MPSHCPSVAGVTFAVVFTLMTSSWSRAAAPAAAPLSYSREQAVAGRGIYNDKCSSCHGLNLQGGAGPALTGADFQKRWFGGDRKVADLYQTLQTMPLDAPGSLSGEQYMNLITLVMAQNGIESGESLAASDINRLMIATLGSGPVALEDPILPLSSFPQPPKLFGDASTDRPDDAELSSNDGATWLMYNKSYSGQRYSSLDQINTVTAPRLAPVCLFQGGEIGTVQSAPVVYDGLLYITTPYNTFAIHPASCTKIWQHRYPADPGAVWSVNRGVALYRGRLFRTTPNGHLIALDARTGKLLWDVWMVDKRHGYWLSGAPVVYDGRVYMGTAGADWGANGMIEAFDAQTGRLQWRFHVIPTGHEVGADTWKQGSQLGGGAFWSTFTIDQSRGQVLVPIGNPAPDFLGAKRPGDNLFTDSVVALDAKTGKLSWWVQQVPHDTHDWDTAAAPVLYDQDGRSYMAVANKGGWLFLYDHSNHRLLAKSEISPHENSDLPLTQQGVHHCPGTLGGADWNGAAYSPKARALFVNSVDWCSTTQVFEDHYVEGSIYLDGLPAVDPVSQAEGFTRAFDAATGKELWARRFDCPMLAGVTPTAGGVLFTGAVNGDFIVLDARDGSTLYRFNTGGAIASEPTTYLMDGRQYVAIASGNNSRLIWQTGGAMTLAVFALHD